MRTRSASGPRRTRELSKRLINLFHSASPFLGRFQKNARLLHSEPNVFVVDHFFTESEMHYFDEIVSQNQKEFKASHTEGSNDERIVSNERTSSFIFLNKAQDSVIRSIENRVADFLGESPSQLEPLQIVRYQQGQYFNLHHDAGTLLDDDDDDENESDESISVDRTTSRQPKVRLEFPLRVVTIFVYLNSLPNGEGVTSFPVLNLDVTPCRGRAVFWCNLREDGSADERVVHSAQPVVSPQLQKYGVNIWMNRENLGSLSNLPVRIKRRQKRKVDDRRCDENVLSKLHAQYVQSISELGISASNE